MEEDEYKIGDDGWVYDPRYFEDQEQKYEDGEYYKDEDKELIRVSCLYLKAYLGNSDAISELNKIAQKHDMKDYKELMDYTDIYLTKHVFQSDSSFREIWITRFVIEEAFRDFPYLNFMVAMDYAKKDGMIFRQIFKDRRDWIDEMEAEIPKPGSRVIKPLPERPIDEASIDDWFKYYNERKELGIPITIGEIAKIKNYSERYLRQLHMRYNYTQDNQRKKKKNT